MLNKINKEIEEFTNTIKEVEGCDKMLNYINSNIYANIKLLMFASKTFSIYARVLIFFIISIAGLTMLSALGTMSPNAFLIAIFLVLFIFALVYVVYFKKIIIESIGNAKNRMQNSMD